MSRCRGSIVACGLAVAVACSFEAARAADKDPKKPAGGQAPAPVQPRPVAPVAPRPVAPVAPIQVVPAVPKQVAPSPVTPSAPKQVQPQPQPRTVAPSTQPSVGKSTGTPLPPFQPNKAGNTAPAGKPAVGSGVPGIPGGTGADTKVNPPGAVGRPPVGNNPATVKPGGAAIPGGQKVETAKPSGGIGPAPTGVGNAGPPPGGLRGPGNPLKGFPVAKPIDGVGPKLEPTEKYSTTKSNIKNVPIKVEPPRTGQPTLGSKGGNLPSDPKGTVKLNPQPEPPGSARSGLPGNLKSGGHEKVKSLAVSKNGLPTPGPSKGRDSKPGDKPGVAVNADKPKGAPQDDKLQSLLQAKKRDDLTRELKQLHDPAHQQAHPELKHLNLDKVSGVHQERLAKPENFQHWQQSNVGQKLNLKQQFELQRQGDLSRRMNLSNNLINAGGWNQHRQHGVIATGFTAGAFSMWYAGGGCYPSHAWCPTWSPWVNWSYWGTCPILYDPRPFYCIPVVYDPCLPWVYYDYPVWNPLPVVACGTWIDVSPVVVTTGQDLQLLAVRFVDNGHPEQNQGPRYRVWARNNSPTQIVTPFSVQLLASNDQVPRAELPQSGVVIPSMDIGETQVLDIRLPLSANRLGTTPEGHRVPFAYLHVLIDSHQQIPETFEDNNGAVVLRKDVLPVDPVAFSTDLTASAPEGLLTLAGEGLGPEPGQVFVSVYGQQVQAEIQGWYDLGIRFEVPNFELSQPVDAEVLVVRGDGAVSNPLTVRLAPKDLIEEAPAFPDSPIPDPPQ